MSRNILVWSTVLVLGLAGGLSAQSSAGAAAPKPVKKAPPAAKKEPKAPSLSSLANLDETQIRSLERLQKMFLRVYGIEELPEDALGEVRAQVYLGVNGTQEPKRPASDKITDSLVKYLREKAMPADGGYQLVREAANVLSEKEISREAIDSFGLKAEKVLSSSSLQEEQARQLIKDFDDLFLSSKKNEAKIKEREEMAQKKMDDEIKELKRKTDELKKKNEQKAKAASRSSGSRRSGGSSSSSP